ncbi:hypothetical protein [Streptomyces sp. NPDC018031]|uniref:hypothetical protein n=1 Tax=Streptomyces sp. NPDC018031 TaxID=3365033 RepID=UPI0037A8894D
MSGADWQRDVLRQLRGEDGAAQADGRLPAPGPAAPGPDPDLAVRPEPAPAPVPADPTAPVAPVTMAGPALSAASEFSAGPADGSGLVMPGAVLPAVGPGAVPRSVSGPAARPPAIPSPTPVPSVDPDLAPAQRRSRSGDSAVRRTSRSLRRLLASSASRQVAEATGVARGLQQPVTTGRQLVVTSIRGGAGKTTVAALLNLTYAHYRQDPVLVVEADPALGTLPIRLGAPSVRWTCSDLAQVISPSMQFAEITGYLVQVEEGGWLLPGSQGRVGTRLELADYRAVMVALRRYFGITVVDCETLPNPLARTALAAAQARVLVAPATVEGVATTRAVLDWMADVPHPRMLPGTVVALTAHSPDAAIDPTAAARHLEAAGVRVVAVPYDRHLAAGGPIRASLLGQETRMAAGRLAAALLDRAVGKGR